MYGFGWLLVFKHCKTLGFVNISCMLKHRDATATTKMFVHAPNVCPAIRQARLQEESVFNHDSYLLNPRRCSPQSRCCRHLEPCSLTNISHLPKGIGRCRCSRTTKHRKAFRIPESSSNENDIVLMHNRINRGTSQFRYGCGNLRYACAG